MTSTLPTAPAGVTAVMEVSLTTVKLAAFAAPNLTSVASVKAEPVMVTVAPPAGSPTSGDTLVTAGALM